MSKHEEKKVWKIRTVKTYPESHNHIIVGRIIDMTESYVRLDCRTYHFGRAVNSIKDICEGLPMVRVIPWARVEIINELADSFDYANAQIACDKDGNINIKDDNFLYGLVSRMEKKY